METIFRNAFFALCFLVRDSRYMTNSEVYGSSARGRGAVTRLMLRLLWKEREAVEESTQHAAVFRIRPRQRGARWCAGLFSCNLAFS
jgi:hypothetical protein